MASKKPAKPMAGQSKQVAQDPATHGSLVMFWGTKNAACACASCGKKTIRGMVRYKSDAFYCSVTCALAS